MSITKSRISQISTICVPIADQERAVEFYCGTLGFEKRADEPFGGGYRWIEVAPAGGATTIALAPPPPNGGVEVGGMQTGITFQTSDADALRDELAEAGVDVDAEVSRMGGPVPPLFWLRDPEANVLMVVEA